MKTVTWDATTTSNPMVCPGGTCVVNLVDLNLVDPECFAETLTANVADPNPLCNDAPLSAIVSQTTSITLTPN